MSDPRFLTVAFHYVGMPKTPYPGIHGLSADVFRQTLALLQSEWTFVSLEDVTNALSGTTALPERACLISFDDGLLCQYEIGLSILDDMDIPAAFFVLGGPYLTGRAATVHKLHYVRANCGDVAVANTIDKLVASGAFAYGPQEVDPEVASQHYRYDTPESARLKYFLNYEATTEFTERVVDQLLDGMGLSETAFVDQYYMTRDMIHNLGKRGALGSHASSHRPLSRMSGEAAIKELAQSRSVLEEISGTPVKALSYPLGNANAVDRNVAMMVKEAGYDLAWTMERAVNRSLDDPQLLARLDAADIGKNNAFGFRQRYLDEVE